MVCLRSAYSHGARTFLKSQVKSLFTQMAVSRLHDNPDVDVFTSQNGIGLRVAIGTALR